MPIPSVDNYVKQHANEYPSLYIGRSFQETKMKVLDQLLNVIGNGIRDDDELMTELFACPDVDVDISKWFDTKISNGYEEIREFDISGTHKKYAMPVGNSTVTCTEAEKADHPEVKLWIECGQHPFNPYPNFKEAYSTIYQCPIYVMLLEKDWIDAAIEFYEYSKQWIVDNESRYHNAYPARLKPKPNGYSKTIGGGCRDIQPTKRSPRLTVVSTPEIWKSSSCVDGRMRRHASSSSSTRH